LYHLKLERIHFDKLIKIDSRVDLYSEKTYAVKGLQRFINHPALKKLGERRTIMNMVERKRVTVVVTNGIIMALYLALTILVSPVASGAIQFRISESLNHLVVFNRKYLWGIFGGVVVYNAIFGMGWLDVVFGGGQTLLALTLTAVLQNVIKNTKIRLALNVVFFSASMFLIALMLNLTAQLPFWPTYGWTALSEAIIMTISAPIMYYLNKRLHFANQL
jgi:uncharacterized membrane protein